MAHAMPPVEINLSTSPEPAVVSSSFEERGPAGVIETKQTLTLEDDEFTPVHSACRHGNLEWIKASVISKAMLEIRDKQKRTALLVACEYGHLEIVKVLVEKYGARLGYESVKDLAPEDDDSFYPSVLTPLAMACLHGHEAVVKYLVEEQHHPVDEGVPSLSAVRKAGLFSSARYFLRECGLEVQAAYSSWCKTPLMCACEGGHLGIVIYLTHTQHANLEVTFNHGRALTYAAENGHLPIVKHLIEHCGTQDRGVDLHYGLGEPIFAACSKGHLHIVIYFLETLRFDPNTALERGSTLLNYACSAGLLTLVKYLIETRGLSANGSECVRGEPLLGACRGGHLEVLKYLVEKHHADLDVISGYHTPLVAACFGRHVAIAKYLIETCRIDVENDRIRSGRSLFTAVHDSMMYCTYENTPPEPLLCYLLTLPSLRAQIASFKDTMLSIAAVNDYLSLAKDLLSQYPSDIEMVDSEGNTPFFVACRNESLEVAQYLAEEHHANIEARNREGETPLLLACRKGKPQILEYLVSERCVDTLASNNRGQTALLIACNAFADINPSGWSTPSSYPRVAADYFTLIKYLVEIVHSDIEARDELGQTPLLMMRNNWIENSQVRSAKLEVAKYLLMQGADVKARDHDGRSLFTHGYGSGGRLIPNIFFQPTWAIHAISQDMDAQDGADESPSYYDWTLGRLQVIRGYQPKTYLLSLEKNCVESDAMEVLAVLQSIQGGPTRSTLPVLDTQITRDTRLRFAQEAKEREAAPQG